MPSNPLQSAIAGQTDFRLTVRHDVSASLHLIAVDAVTPKA